MIKDSLKVGDRVRVLEDKVVDFDEWGKGEEGVVTDVQQGMVVVLLDVYHSALYMWGNEFIWIKEDFEHRSLFDWNENLDEQMLKLKAIEKI